MINLEWDNGEIMETPFPLGIDDLKLNDKVVIVPNENAEGAMMYEASYLENGTLSVAWQIFGVSLTKNFEIEFTIYLIDDLSEQLTDFTSEEEEGGNSEIFVTFSNTINEEPKDQYRSFASFEDCVEKCSCEWTNAELYCSFSPMSFTIGIPLWECQCP